MGQAWARLMLAPCWLYLYAYFKLKSTSFYISLYYVASFSFESYVSLRCVVSFYVMLRYVTLCYVIFMSISRFVILGCVILTKSVKIGAQKNARNIVPYLSHSPWEIRFSSGYACR